MITLVRNDDGDWVALYKDGRLVDQGHSFQEERLLTLLEIEHETIYADPEATGLMFPATLEEAVPYGESVEVSDEPEDR